MRYREFRVAPWLAKYVECFWVLESGAVRHAVAPERLLPDGCVELMLNFGDLFCEYTHANGGVLQPRRYVAGQMTRPVLVAPTGVVQLLGLRFVPGGTLPFFPTPPSEFTDRITPLADLAPALDRALSERPFDVRTMEERLPLIESILQRHIRAKTEKGASVQHAVTRLIKHSGQISVDELAADLGISGRQLERRFLSEVGLGPKLLSRILRFQQVFRAVERADANWAEIAAACGYYDQAHLIRDFRQFAGQTPAILFDQFTRFTEVFTRKQRMSDFYNTAD